jgi:hypothetical protein
MEWFASCPGLVPGIHVFGLEKTRAGKDKTWMAGTSPAMTTKKLSAWPPSSA